jgi:hypothetical protein
LETGCLASSLHAVKIESAIDENGAPLLLVAARLVPTRSGNSAHEIATGRFGSTGQKKKEEEKAPAPQPGSSDGSEQRRRDAVVDAARTLDDLTSAGVEKFVRQRWSGRRALTKEDVEQFAADARRQRVHDVVDALDYRIRKAVLGRAGSKQPHVEIPRGLQRKSLSGLDDGEVATIFARLRERGWSSQQIKRHGIRRIDTDNRLQNMITDSEGE